jgi:hypothetical protein
VRHPAILGPAPPETNESLHWHDPQFLADVEHWVDEHVDRSGAIEQLHSSPWATAIRIPTAAGSVWFKACIRELAHEIRTLELLAARRPHLVPRVLASDRKRSWLLLEDAGEPLRERNSHPGQLERWEEAVALYAELQLDVAADADAFVAGGVPDRRGSVVAQFMDVIEDDRVTKPIDEPLSEREVAELRALIPRLAAEEAEVDALGLPYSIQHDDLHDDNIFIRDGEYRIIDWGDACVANPLLSLTITLEFAAQRFHVAFDAPEVGRVRDAYIEPFTALRTRDEIRDAVPAAIRIGHACGTVTWSKVMTVIPLQWRAPFHRGIPRRLRRLLELCA